MRGFLFLPILALGAVPFVGAMLLDGEGRVGGEIRRTISDARIVLESRAATLEWGREATEWANRAPRGDGAYEPMPEAPAGSLPDLLREENAQSALERMFAPGLDDAGSVVTLTQRYPFEAILAPGEAAPPEALRPVWAVARAPAQAIGLCETLLLDLATACDVRGTRAWLDGDEVRVEVSLGYVPASPIGTPAAAEGARIVGTALGEPIEIAGRETDLPDLAHDPEGRAEVYRRVDAVCAELRARFGNCEPSRLTLTGAPVPGASLRARLRVRVHAEGVAPEDIAAVIAPG